MWVIEASQRDGDVAIRLSYAEARDVAIVLELFEEMRASIPLPDPPRAAMARSIAAGLRGIAGQEGDEDE